MAYTMDRETLDRLKTVDDATLQQLIRSLAKAAGVNPVKTTIATGNVRLLRQKLTQAKPEEINRLLAAVDEKQAAAILQQFRKNG